MALEDLISRPLTGIRPFNELPIDADIWREAHEHHHHHRRLHALSTHRPGIVCGLEVVSAGGHRVAIAPGVGIDSNGHTLVLSEPVYFNVSEKGQTYITLSFLRTADRDSAVNVGGGVQYFRVVEGRDLTESQELPRHPHLELARIYRTGAQSDLRDAKDPLDPDSNEINLLHRAQAFPFCWGDFGVGELSYVPRDDPRAWKPNRAGLLHLLRHANAAGFHCQFHGPLDLRASGTRAPALLYVAGAGAFAPLSQAETDGLAKFLASGGTLIAEATGGKAGADEDFEHSFTGLAGRLGANLKPVEGAHPLLRSHHVFAAAPSGAEAKGELSCDLRLGLIWSRRNYGAAWQGIMGAGVEAAPRENIREATEFGLNVLAWAQSRRRAFELTCLLEGV